MRTIDYIRNRIRNLPVVLTDSELLSYMNQQSTLHKEYGSDLVPVDANERLFKLQFPPVMDNSLVVYKSDSLTDVENPINTLSIEVFDISNTSFIQTDQIAIDASTGYVQFLAPPNFEGCFYLLKYVEIDYQNLLQDILLDSSFSEEGRITSEARGDIRESKMSLLEIARRQRELFETNSEIEVIDMTRTSHGVTHGDSNNPHRHWG